MTELENKAVTELNPYSTPRADLTMQGTAVVYAGFWRRFFAYMLDSIIVFVPMMLIGSVLGVVATEQTATSIDAHSTSNAFSILVGVLGVIYFAAMESSAKQATFGKMALGIKVTDMHGQRIGFGKAIGRYFGKIVSALILYIGFFMAGFTKNKQALHDMMAGTLVVKK